ncbi:hypothetical protein [Paracoccus aminophilus]|uniref:hypothetical protein n=1 Tax=Paracoccus aminophilus TaxID=34003 RepID=UPI00059F3DC0|nr:hypothetical protein [Paracoccus aminophilus]
MQQAPQLPDNRQDPTLTPPHAETAPPADQAGAISTDNLRKLLDAATPGPWTGANMVHADRGDAMTPEEIGEYVCNSVRIGDPAHFLFVSGKHDDGGDADICHTGNGPRGPWNTALIALAPQLAAEVLALRELIATGGAA